MAKVGAIPPPSPGAAALGQAAQLPAEGARLALCQRGAAGASGGRTQRHRPCHSTKTKYPRVFLLVTCSKYGQPCL